jgi:hypothetical protein
MALKRSSVRFRLAPPLLTDIFISNAIAIG